MNLNVDTMRDAQVQAINQALDDGDLELADQLDDTLVVLNRIAIERFSNRLPELVSEKDGNDWLDNLIQHHMEGSK